ncbi:MAG: hypothetical protein HQK91_01200 [Nitrospirae bacterium]|nr:hypothetical protein [Nitrospirota bacterium]MBF0540053.1 hypothetical protein [Nitrospirota bacterium]
MYNINNMVRPQFKILLYIFFAVLLFSTKNIEISLSIGIFLLLIFMFYPERKMRSGSIYIIIFLTAVFIGNIFDGQGREGGYVYHFLFINISESGLSDALVKTLQIFSMIVGAKLLIINTGIPDLIAGLGRICSPLKIIKIPVDEFIELMYLTVTALNGITGEIIEKARIRSKQNNMSQLSEKLRFIVEIVLPLLIVTIKSPEKLFIQKEQNV